jgi:hypothetical protein
MKEPRIEDWMLASSAATDLARRAKVRKIARRLQRRGNTMKSKAAKRWQWLTAEIC